VEEAATATGTRVPGAAIEQLLFTENQRAALGELDVEWA
jgi:hypothetical protein